MSLDNKDQWWLEALPLWFVAHARELGCCDVPLITYLNLVRWFEGKGFRFDIKEVGSDRFVADVDISVPNTGIHITRHIDTPMPAPVLRRRIIDDVMELYEEFFLVTIDIKCSK